MTSRFFTFRGYVHVEINIFQCRFGTSSSRFSRTWPVSVDRKTQHAKIKTLDTWHFPSPLRVGCLTILTKIPSRWSFCLSSRKYLCQEGCQTQRKNSIDRCNLILESGIPAMPSNVFEREIIRPCGKISLIIRWGKRVSNIPSSLLFICQTDSISLRRTNNSS